MKWFKNLMRGMQATTISGEARGDQVLRKEWAESLLHKKRIRINKHLPFTESEAETTLRSVKEVSDRLYALVAVAAKGEGLEQAEVLKFLDRKEARSSLSPDEVTFIDDQSPSQEDRIKFSWRYEGAWVMYWALGQTDGPLAFPDSICKVKRLVNAVNSAANFYSTQLQSTNKVLNETDLHYRYHWAVRQSLLDGQDPGGGLDRGVVMERHKALNWLVRYSDGADWDDVNTDT